MRSVVGSGRARRLVGLGVLAFALAVPAACGGSALNPKEVRAANDAVAGGSSAVVDGGTGSTGTTGTTGTGSTGTTGTGSTGTTGTGSTGTGSTGTGSTGTTGSGGSGGGGGSAAPAGSGIKAGSCTGFKNGPGVTDKTIAIGNSSDLSGPVPGLFQAAQDATKAYVAYFNATSSICGRKLQLSTLDSRTDAGADQQSYQKLCETVFAAVGSMSAFDSGGAGTAQGCGLPDIRTAAVTATRNACSTCFGAQATGPYEFTNEIPDFFLKNYHAPSQKAAFVYLNAGAAAENAKTQQTVETNRGMHFVYSAGIDVATFNYGPYVQAMKSAGVRWVQFLGGYQQAVRLAQAMQSAGFKPDVYFLDPTAYDPGFVQSGGSAVEGTIIFVNFSPFEEPNPQVSLYRQWLAQVAPGAQPTFFGEFGWSAAKLFADTAIALGGQLTRASLVAKIRGIHAWTGGGMHSPMDVGGKHSPSCARFLQLRGGKWVPIFGTAYVCHGYGKAR